MSIADKLMQIAENEQKVYDAGKVVGESLGYEKGYQEGHNVGQTEGIEQGKQAEYDRFWRYYLSNHKNNNNYLYAFAGLGWRDEVYDPPVDVLIASQNATNMYAYSRITDTKVPIDISGATSNTVSMFDNATYLKTIRKLIVSETTSTIGFSNCTALVDITFEGTLNKAVTLAKSSKLSTESVDSIIAALKDLTGLNTKTLTLHATVGGALTEVQKAAITAKNWTLAY